MSRTRVKTTDRILAALLSVLMLLAMLPVAGLQVMAATEGHPDAYTITVTDEADAPVEEASVTIRNTEYSLELSGITDEKGVVAFETEAIQSVLTDNALDKISVELSISKNGYESYNELVDIAEDSLTANIPVTLAAEGVTQQADITITVTGDADVEINGEKQNTATVDVGSEVPVQITPAVGSYIKELHIDGETVSVPKGEAYSDIIKVEKDIQITAVIIREVTVEVSKNEGGTVTLNNKETDSLKVDINTKVELSIRADEGYQISSVTIGGQDQELVSTTTFDGTVVADDNTVIDVSFAKVYTVTITHNENGTVTTEPSSTGGSVTVGVDESVTINATPEEHYRVSQVVINDKPDADIEGINDENYSKVLDPNSDYIITVTFAPNRYDITVGETSNGSVTAESSSVAHGDSVKVYIRPAEGYTLATVIVNGDEVTDITPSDDNEGYFVISSIVEEQKISATFKESSPAVMSDVSFNADEALSGVESYVFPKESIVTFETAKDGIRLYDSSNDIIDGVYDENSAQITETKTVDRISLYYQAEGDLMPAWHDVADLTPLKIVIDETPVVLELNPQSANHHGYYNADVKVVISAEEPEPYSGIASVEYAISKDGAELQWQELYRYTDGGEVKTSYSESIVVDAEVYNSDNVVVYVKAIDRAGNETPQKSVALKINSTPPEVSVSINGAAVTNENEVGVYNAPRTATITYADRNTTFDKNAAMEGINITAKDAEGKDLVISPDSMIEWTDSGSEHTATIIFSTDAIYEWSVSYTNKAGLSDDTVETSGDFVYQFAVDTTAPDAKIALDEGNVWDVLLETLTFGIFKNSSVTAEVTASDATTRVEEIVYYKSNETTALGFDILDDLYEGGSFQKDPFTVGADEKFVVYARITDLAGNTKYISTNGVIYDKTTGGIDIAPSIPNENGIYTGDVEVVISVDDTAAAGAVSSGIKTIDYKVEAKFADSTEPIVTDSGNLFTFNVENPAYDQLVTAWNNKDDPLVIDAESNNSDDVTVTVTVKDNAGNTYTETLEPGLKIVMDKPTAVLSFIDEVYNEHRLEANYFTERSAKIVLTGDRAFNADSATKGIQISAIDSEEEAIYLVPGEDYTISGWEGGADERNTYTATIAFHSDGNYTIGFNYLNDTEVDDNRIELEKQSFTIDTKMPFGEVSIQDNTWGELLEILTFGLYSNTSVDVSAAAEDETSPYVIEFYMTDNPIALTEEELDELDESNFKPFEEFTVESDEQFVIYLKITDYAGNYTYVSSDGYIVDQTGSTIILTPSADNGYYDDEAHQTGLYGLYNKDSDVTVDIQVVDSVPYSGIQSVEYWIENNGVKTQEDTLFTFTVDDEKGPAQSDLVNEWDGTVTVDKASNNSCDVWLYVRTIDNAGNKQEKSIQLDIDTTAPVIDVSFDNNEDNGGNGYFDGPRTATITITERSHHFDADAATDGIVITAEDAQGNPVEEAYVISEWVTIENRDNLDAATHTATVSFEKDANYTFGIAYTDQAGNSNEGVNTDNSVAPFDFTVDTTTPTGTVKATSDEGRETEWNELRDTLTFGFWSKEKITISGTASDLTSPVASVEYHKVKATVAGDGTTALSEEELDAVTAWTPFDGLEIAADEQFTVYIRITDMAGNYAYISTNGLIVDHTAPMEETIAPEITVEPPQPINGFYNGDVKVTIKVVDPLVGGTYSGLKTVRYRVLNMGEETQSGTLYAFDNADPLQSDLLQTWTGEITVDSASNNSNDVVIEVYAEDNSLNASDDEVAIQIDITAPNIDISYDNNSADNDSYFQNNRTATIVVTERNFSPEDVQLTITNTDGVIPTLSAWEKAEGTGNLDDTTWTATVTYSADGDYTFDIVYTDLADNACAGANYGSSVSPTEFTVDKTLPTISVSYDNNAASNGTYFAAPRTATVVITEHNFDVNRVVFTQTASLDGAAITIPSPSWSSNGDVHTAVIAFTDDGDYTFEVAVTDMAANESDAANYGNSVAGNAFTVDQTIEKPVIGGVANGSAYKNDVIPTISFSDVNYDSYEVRLLRTRMGEKDVDVTDTFITSLTEEAQGGSGTYDTFEEIVENDGIYTLTVTMTDKAGNQETEEYTFTVNRFGSVYEYGDYLVSLIKDGGQYITVSGDNGAAVTEDLVITEYNADRLLEGSLNILITRDGESVNADYTTSPALINNQVEIGESGWYQYVYTIKASNFAEDGVYKITLSSAYATVDAEQNESASVPENSVDAEGNPILDTISFTVDTVAPEIRNIVNLDEAIVNAQTLDVQYTVVDVGGLKSVEIILNGETLDTVTEFGDSQFNYSGQFTINESSEAQTVQIRVTDLAGNVTDTAADDFSTGDLYVFNDRITVSTNFFVRWYANPVLFWSSIAGVVVLAAAICFIVAFKRKKKAESK